MRNSKDVLVQLLVVIIVVVILAVILWPVFCNAARKSAQMSCENNMRRMVTAAKMYTHDHAYLLPPVEYWQENDFSWAVQYWPEVQDRYVCPGSVDQATIANLGPKVYRGYGHSLLLSKLSGGKAKAFLWDGTNLNEEDASLLGEKFEMIDFKRHQWCANVAWLDGRVSKEAPGYGEGLKKSDFLP